MADIQIKFPGGVTQKVFLKRLAKALQPTVGDLVSAMQIQHRKIQERTARGVDADSRRFTPYDNKRPYYWYPDGVTKGQKSLTRSQRQSRNRFFKQASIREQTLTGNSLKRGSVRKTNKTKKGIKFPSYAAFKRSFGRTVVDLFGIRGNKQHMLLSMVVKAGSFSQKADKGKNIVDASRLPAKANEATLSVVGEPVERARAHNTGVGKRAKKRTFLAWGADELNLARKFVASRMVTRARRVMSGESLK